MIALHHKHGLVFRLISLLSLGCFAGGVASAATIAGEDDPGASTNVVPETEAPAQPAETGPVIPHSARERVHIGNSLRMEADEVASEVATIFGSSDVAGTVEDNMATVFGSSTLSGTVGGNMATVFGSSHMSGKVGDNMVNVFGNADVNGIVNGNLVTVFGSITLGSNAVVKQECVAVFGRIDKQPGAVVAKEPLSILPQFAWLTDYIRTGLLMGRPLSSGSMLAWVVVALHFALYFLIGLILPKPTAAGVRQLDDHFFLSFGVGLLAMFLMAPLFGLLAATGVGAILIPFIGMVETAFAVLGKTATLQFFGLQINRRFSGSTQASPLAGFLVGFALVTLIYMVPVLGGICWLALRPLALGAAVMAVIKAMKRDGKPQATLANPASPTSAASAGIAPAASVGFAASGATTAESSAGFHAPAFQSPPVTAEMAAPKPEVTALPRAGFWIRVVAAALDFVLLVWLIPFVHAFFPFVWLGYHIAMWGWKGTTIGGIVCNLKLVRVNGQPIDFAVALVRGLASVFSFMALFLGFFWTGWFSERQSWHDIIAGTVMVRVPRTTPLV